MKSASYFDSEYDVIVIGAALAGLSAALDLAKAGKKVLVLEQHELPGGVATSYCRGGVEFEASLHEMMCIGEKDHPLQCRAFLESHGVDVDWVRVPEAYRYVDDEVDAVIRSGMDGDIVTPAKDIAKACGEEEENGPIFIKVLDFLTLCQKIDASCTDVQNNKRSLPYIALHHPEMSFTSGYSVKEVMESFHLPKKAMDVLSAYWIYLGSPASSLPFTVYAVVLAQYLGNGSYIPRHTSFEMAVKMLERARAIGAQVEFRQKVEKILVDDKGVRGVRLSSGTEIQSRIVLCGAYPNTVYSKMLEEGVEVPRHALKAAHARKLGVSAFSVVLLLDKSPEELGIKDYATFLYVDKSDDDIAFARGKTQGPYTYIACVCPNIVLPDCCPKGMSVYSLTYLPNGEGFAGVNERNYGEISRKNASFFIEKASKMLGVNLFDHIAEITLETPVTISHYTGAYQGTIYGYSHDMDAHIVARIMNPKFESSFPGLYFIGAHHLDGDGMAPAINSGRHVAREVLGRDRR